MDQRSKDLSYLGLGTFASESEIRTAYRRKSLYCHPGSPKLHAAITDETTAEFRKLHAVYSRLTSTHTTSQTCARQSPPPTSTNQSCVAQWKPSRSGSPPPSPPSLSPSPSPPPPPSTTNRGRLHKFLHGFAAGLSSSSKGEVSTQAAPQARRQTVYHRPQQLQPQAIPQTVYHRPQQLHPQARPQTIMQPPLAELAKKQVEELRQIRNARHHSSPPRRGYPSKQRLFVTKVAAVPLGSPTVSAAISSSTGSTPSVAISGDGHKGNVVLRAGDVNQEAVEEGKAPAPAQKEALKPKVPRSPPPPSPPPQLEHDKPTMPEPVQAMLAAKRRQKERQEEKEARIQDYEAKRVLDKGDAAAALAGGPLRPLSSTTSATPIFSSFLFDLLSCSDSTQGGRIFGTIRTADDPSPTHSALPRVNDHEVSPSVNDFRLLGGEKRRDKTSGGRQAEAIGLCNMGNTCYLNVALQSLLLDPFVQQYFLAHFEPNGRNSIVDEYCRLQRSYVSAHVALTPQAFQKALNQSTISDRHPGGLFPLGREHDASEVLINVLDAWMKIGRPLHLWDKPPALTDAEKWENRSQVAEENWCTFTTQFSSLVARRYTGLYSTNLRCTTCDRSSDRFECATHLQLSMPTPSVSSSTLSFEELIATHTANEQVHGRRCDNCKSVQLATRTLCVWRAPEKLVLVIKRFAFHPLTGELMKIGTRIGHSNSTFVVRTAEGHLCKYAIDSFGVHIGSSIGSGHYVAYSYSKGLQLNDESVTTTTPQQLNAKLSEAYYLVATKVETLLLRTSISQSHPAPAAEIPPLKRRFSQVFPARSKSSADGRELETIEEADEAQHTSSSTTTVATGEEGQNDSSTRAAQTTVSRDDDVESTSSSLSGLSLKSPPAPTKRLRLKDERPNTQDEAREEGEDAPTQPTQDDVEEQFVAPAEPAVTDEFCGFCGFTATNSRAMRTHKTSSVHKEIVENWQAMRELSTQIVAERRSDEDVYVRCYSIYKALHNAGNVQRFLRALHAVRGGLSGAAESCSDCMLIDKSLARYSCRGSKVNVQPSIALLFLCAATADARKPVLMTCYAGKGKARYAEKCANPHHFILRRPVNSCPIEPRWLGEGWTADRACTAADESEDGKQEKFREGDTNVLGDDHNEEGAAEADLFGFDDTDGGDDGGDDASTYDDLELASHVQPEEESIEEDLSRRACLEATIAEVKASTNLFDNHQELLSVTLAMLLNQEPVTPLIMSLGHCKRPLKELLAEVEHSIPQSPHLPIGPLRVQRQAGRQVLLGFLQYTNGRGQRHIASHLTPADATLRQREEIVARVESSWSHVKQGLVQLLNTTNVLGVRPKKFLTLLNSGYVLGSYVDFLLRTAGLDSPDVLDPSKWRVNESISDYRTDLIYSYGLRKNAPISTKLEVTQRDEAEAVFDLDVDDAELKQWVCSTLSGRAIASMIVSLDFALEQIGLVAPGGTVNRKKKTASKLVRDVEMMKPSRPRTVYPLMTEDIEYLLDRQPPANWADFQNYTYLLFAASLGARHSSISAPNHYFRGIRWGSITFRRASVSMALPSVKPLTAQEAERCMAENERIGATNEGAEEEEDEEEEGEGEEDLEKFADVAHRATHAEKFDDVRRKEEIICASGGTITPGRWYIDCALPVHKMMRDKTKKLRLIIVEGNHKYDTFRMIVALAASRGVLHGFSGDLDTSTSIEIREDCRSEFVWLQPAARSLQLGQPLNRDCVRRLYDRVGEQLGLERGVITPKSSRMGSACRSVLEEFTANPDATWPVVMATLRFNYNWSSDVIRTYFSFDQCAMERCVHLYRARENREQSIRDYFPYAHTTGLRGQQTPIVESVVKAFRPQWEAQFQKSETKLQSLLHSSHDSLTEELSSREKKMLKVAKDRKHGAVYRYSINCRSALTKVIRSLLRGKEPAGHRAQIEDTTMIDVRSHIERWPSIPYTRFQKRSSFATAPYCFASPTTKLVCRCVAEGCDAVFQCELDLGTHLRGHQQHSYRCPIGVEFDQCPYVAKTVDNNRVQAAKSLARHVNRRHKPLTYICYECKSWTTAAHECSATRPAAYFELRLKLRPKDSETPHPPDSSTPTDRDSRPPLDLHTWLRSEGVNESVLTTLIENEVGTEEFLLLDRDAIIRMGIKIGPMVKLEQLITKLREIRKP